MNKHATCISGKNKHTSRNLDMTNRLPVSQLRKNIPQVSRVRTNAPYVSQVRTNAIPVSWVRINTLPISFKINLSICVERPLYLYLW